MSSPESVSTRALAAEIDRRLMWKPCPHSGPGQTFHCQRCRVDALVAVIGGVRTAAEQADGEAQARIAALTAENTQLRHQVEQLRGDAVDRMLRQAHILGPGEKLGGRREVGGSGYGQPSLSGEEREAVNGDDSAVPPTPAYPDAVDCHLVVETAGCDR